MGTGNILLGVTLRRTSIPSMGRRNSLGCFMDATETRRGEGAGGWKPPASRTLESRFPPCICWLPPLCIFFYCKILHNVAYFFFFSPVFPPPWQSYFPSPLLLVSRAPCPPPQTRLNCGYVGVLWLIHNYTCCSEEHHKTDDRVHREGCCVEVPKLVALA